MALPGEPSKSLCASWRTPAQIVEFPDCGHGDLPDLDQLWSFRPNRTLVQSAANGRFEPRLTDAALAVNVRFRNCYAKTKLVPSAFRMSQTLQCLRRMFGGVYQRLFRRFEPFVRMKFPHRAHNGNGIGQFGKKFGLLHMKKQSY